MCVCVCGGGGGGGGKGGGGMELKLASRDPNHRPKLDLNLRNTVFTLNIRIP